ncbi:serine/threonine-protein kinase [Glycomyces terrestris]|uniref:serine/threonine-protein kinase n=1 Tax=Glycomyces terrestris TaxID=2493553 RepID=UPI0018D4FF4F|nr:serine/threonine-protein kinase [Glycomyces terrestris]
MTYSSDSGRGGPGAYEDPRSGPAPSPRYSPESQPRPQARGGPGAAYGPEPGARHPDSEPGGRAWGSERGGRFSGSEPGGRFSGSEPGGRSWGSEPGGRFSGSEPGGRSWGSEPGGRFGGPDPYDSSRQGYNRDPYGGDSYGDSSYRHSSSYGNYGNLGQSFAVGGEPGRPPGPALPGNRARPGDLVGDRYRLEDLVGKGGNGSVWRAHDTVLRREVALKEVFLPPDLPPHERVQLIDRSRREAQIAAGLSHPSVIRVFDVVEHAGLPWIVMELLQSRSLAEILSQDGPLPPRVAAKIGLALVGALQAAHDAGIIHRDVKPGNVLISVDGRCVLSDFGAAQLHQVSGGTTPGKVLGSAHYIAPERAVGHPAEPASDVFSLGVTLYAAVEGRPPFDRGDAVSTMRAVVQEPPESPRNAGPLTPLLGGMLAKDPGQRMVLPQVRQELQALLAGPLAGPGGPGHQSPPYRAGQGFPEASPPHTGPRPRVAREPEPEPAANPWRSASVIAICVLLVLVLGWGAFKLLTSDGGGGGAEDAGSSEGADGGESAAEDGGESPAEEGAPFATAAYEGDGFTVNRPADWVEGEGGEDHVVFANPEDDTQWVRIYSGSEKGAEGTEDWLSGYFDGLDAEMTDLEQVQLAEVEIGGMSGTVLEYTGTNLDEAGAERHSIWALVDGGDGTTFGVFVSGDADVWELSQAVYSEAAASFQTG